MDPIPTVSSYHLLPPISNLVIHGWYLQDMAHTSNESCLFPEDAEALDPPREFIRADTSILVNNRRVVRELHFFSNGALKLYVVGLDASLHNFNLPSLIPTIDLSILEQVSL